MLAYGGSMQADYLMLILLINIPEQAHSTGLPNAVNEVKQVASTEPNPSNNSR
jgi:hypothetical protein